jgi:hypothetical protein
MREIEIKATRVARPAVAATEARYRRMVAEWTQGNETAAAVAERHGIAAGTLRWWGSELKRRDRERAEVAGESGAELLPVRVTAPWPSPAPRSAVFEVALRGGQRIVRIQPGFDPAEVRALVNAVEGAPC